MMSDEKLNQIIYEMMLLDDRFRCTCDDSAREDSFFQASGHYHHCMLYQVTRAIHLTYRYLKDDPTLLSQASVQKILNRNNLSRKDNP